MAVSEAPDRVIGQRVLRPREQVEERLRSMILTGELGAGERLPSEAELARQFMVSRTTIREALGSIQTQSLIEKVPGARGGSFVRNIDHHSLGTLLQESLHSLLQLQSLTWTEVAMTRQYLEVPSARLAARNRSEQHLGLLTKIVDRQKSITVDSPQVPDLDAQFHATIADASGNRLLAAFVRALHQETEPVRFLDLSPAVGRETVRQHHNILRAIERRQPEAAENAVIEHLTYLRAQVTPA